MVVTLVLSMHYRYRQNASSKLDGSRYAIQATDATFQLEVIEEDRPVLVMFQAPWCQPCRQMKPTWEKVANRYSGKVKFVTVNGDESEFSRQKFQVDRYPTLMIFRQGKELMRLVGLVSENDLMDWIETILKSMQAQTTLDK